MRIIAQKPSNHGAVKKRVAAEIRLKYQQQFKHALWYRRWLIEWKIRKEVERTLASNMYCSTAMTHFSFSNDLPKK